MVIILSGFFVFQVQAQPERMYLGNASGEAGTVVTLPVDFRDDSPVLELFGEVAVPSNIGEVIDFRCLNVPIENNPPLIAQNTCFETSPNLVTFNVPKLSFSDFLTPGRVLEIDIRLGVNLPDGFTGSASMLWTMTGFFGTREDEVDTGIVKVAIDRSGFFDDICTSELPGPPDPFEPDNVRAAATIMVARLASGASAEVAFVFDSHTFHDSADEDWVVFQAYDDNRTYSLEFRNPDSEPGTGLPMDPSLRRGVGLLVQYFDQFGNLLGLSGGGNIPTDALDDYNPDFTGACFDPIPNSSFQGVRNFEGQVFARILQCRNAGLDVDNDNQADDGQYCLVPDGAQYRVAATANLEANPGVVKGRVLDAVSGQPVVFAAVTGIQIANFTTFSNFNGDFIQDDTRTLTPATAVIEADGYEDVNIQFNINEGEITDCGDIQMPREVGGAPDLQLASPSVSPNVTLEGTPVVSSAIISNIGDSESPPTIVRFIASADPIITTADPEYASANLPAMAPGIQATATATSPSPVDLPIPIYMGACVDTTPGEQNPGNNCFGFSPLFLDSRIVFVNGFESPVIKSSIKRPSVKKVTVTTAAKGAITCNIIP